MSIPVLIPTQKGLLLKAVSIDESECFLKVITENQKHKSKSLKFGINPVSGKSIRLRKK